MRIQGKVFLKECTFFQLISQYRKLELNDIVKLDWENEYIVKTIFNAKNSEYIKYSLINIDKGYKIYLSVSKENNDNQYIIYNNLKDIIKIDNSLVTINNKRLPKNSDYYIKYINKYNIKNLFELKEVTKDETE